MGMSSIAYRAGLTGLLNSVVVAVLLGCVSLTAGLACGTLFPGNDSATRLGVKIVMHAKSSYTIVRPCGRAAARAFWGDLIP
jgi:hypothetical protein